jgi:hypothetical protein
MAKMNIQDNGSYQEKQKLKTRKNFFDFTQQELDEARDKEQEKSRKIAEDNARYGMDRIGQQKKPAKSFTDAEILEQYKKHMSKRKNPKKEPMEPPIRERQTLESILPKPLGEE